MKVVILAAGPGSKISPKYNGLHKALLPINNRPIISHIIDKITRGTSCVYKNDRESVCSTEFIFVTGYQSDVFESYIRTIYDGYLNMKFIYNEDWNKKGKNGPGQSLLLCKEIIGNEKFICITCDTLFDKHDMFYDFSNPSLSDEFNWIGISEKEKSDDGSKYTYVSLDPNIEISYDSSSELIFNGVFGIKDTKEYFELLESENSYDEFKNEIATWKAFNLLSGNKLYKSFESIDFGNIEVYESIVRESKNEMVFRKDGEFIYRDFCGYKINEEPKYRLIKIIKYNKDKKIINNLAERSKEVEMSVVYNKINDYMVVTDYIDGYTLDECSYEEIDKFFDEYEKILEKRFNITDEQTRSEQHFIAGDLYITKTINRSSLINKEDLDKIKSCILSEGREILYELKFDENVLKNLHGDLQPENIMFDPTNNRFCLVDLRHSFSDKFLASTFDVHYDLGKLLHGCLVSNKLEINSDKEYIQITDKHKYIANKLHEMCIRLNIDFGYVQTIAILHFINIVGLYKDKYPLYYNKLIKFILFSLSIIKDYIISTYSVDKNLNKHSKGPAIICPLIAAFLSKDNRFLDDNSLEENSYE